MLHTTTERKIVNAHQKLKLSKYGQKVEYAPPTSLLPPHADECASDSDALGRRGQPFRFVPIFFFVAVFSHPYTFCPLLELPYGLKCGLENGETKERAER